MNLRLPQQPFDGSDGPDDAPALVAEWRSFATRTLEHETTTSPPDNVLHEWFKGPRVIAILACRGFVRRTRAELLEEDWQSLLQQLDAAPDPQFARMEPFDRAVRDLLAQRSAAIADCWSHLLRHFSTSASESISSDRFNRRFLDETDVVALACAEYALLTELNKRLTNDTSLDPSWTETCFRHLDDIALRAVQLRTARNWFAAANDSLSADARRCARWRRYQSGKPASGDDALGAVSCWIASAASRLGNTEVRSAEKQLVSGGTGGRSERTARVAESRLQLATYLLNRLVQAESPLRAAAAPSSIGKPPVHRFSWNGPRGEVATWLDGADGSTLSVVLRLFDKRGEPSSAFDGCPAQWLGLSGQIRQDRVSFDRTALLAMIRKHLEAAHGSSETTPDASELLRSWLTSNAASLKIGDVEFTTTEAE